MVANWLQQPQLSHLHTIVYKMEEVKNIKEITTDDVLVWEGFQNLNIFRFDNENMKKGKGQYRKASTHRVCLRASTGTSVDHQLNDFTTSETDLANESEGRIPKPTSLSPLPCTVVLKTETNVIDGE